MKLSITPSLVRTWQLVSPENLMIQEKVIWKTIVFYNLASNAIPLISLISYWLSMPAPLDVGGNRRVRTKK